MSVKSILINCGMGGPDKHWDGHSLKDGIGGSEAQAIGLAESLVKLGHRVTILNNCGSDNFINGVVYRVYSPYAALDKKYDVHVAWRNYSLLTPRVAPIQVLSCHDIPVYPHCPTLYSDTDHANIDAFWLLNRYHSDIYHPHVPKDKHWVCPIGINTTPYMGDMARVAGKCIYLSHPDRGLHDLRRVWPLIKAAVPYATLHAFWWEQDRFLSEHDDLGIMPMRSLGEDEMAVELLTSDLFTYPCCFSPEISPAVTIKAQMAGAIPVYIPQGGMVDTVKYGYRCNNLDDFVEEVVYNLTDRHWRYNERLPMRRWAVNNYAWENVARIWEDKWLKD